MMFSSIERCGGMAYFLCTLFVFFLERAVLVCTLQCVPEAADKWYAGTAFSLLALAVMRCVINRHRSARKLRDGVVGNDLMGLEGSKTIEDLFVCLQI